MEGFSTDAVVLRKVEYGDHDLILSLLTESRGKISVMAKNAKKSVKRFPGSLDLFTLHHVLCTFPKKKKDGLIILSQADLKEGFVNIRYDVMKTAFAGFWSELIHFWLEEDGVKSGLYDLLTDSLDALDKGVIPGEVTNLLFQIRFMDYSGFYPSIEACDQCKTPLDLIEQNHVRFDFKEGRIICQKCRVAGSGKRTGEALIETSSEASRERRNYGMTVSKGTLKQLFWINNAGIERADRIKFSNLAIKEGEILLESFISFHMGRDFKSLGFLRRLRREK